MIADGGASLDALLNPVLGGGDGDAEAIVFADEEDGQGELLIGDPGGGVEAALGGGVIEGGVTEATYIDGVLGEARVASAVVAAAVGEGGADGFGGVRGDGGGLGRDAEFGGAPDFVPSSGDGVFFGGNKAQAGIEDGALSSFLPGPLHHEGAASIVEEGHVCGAAVKGDEAVAFVAGAADGVEAFVLGAEFTGDEVEGAVLHLGVEDA